MESVCLTVESDFIASVQTKREGGTERKREEGERGKEGERGIQNETEREGCV